MGLLSWLKKKPADGGDQPAEAPPAEEAPAESAADLAESLSASDGALRVDAARALLDRLRNGDDEARKALAARIGDLFSDEEPAVRATALSALRLLHAPELLEAHQSAVLALLADPAVQVRTTAVWSAASIPGDTARTQVRAVLSSEEEPLRFAAACALSELGDSAAVPELTAALREDHRRQEALSAL
ncbi:MAG: HEAT repeat domain-containing protein, partial [Myxococcales bacterium]